MNIFDKKSYREVVRDALAQRKQVFGRAYTYEKLAKACRVQRPYLSAVLAGNGHLSSDQIFLAVEFLGFSEDERHYTALLNEYERSVCEPRRKVLRKSLDAVRQRALQTKNYVSAKAQNVVSEARTEFYLDFNAQLIHMFLTVSRYRQNLKAIQKILQLDDEVFQNALSKVEKAGLIEISGSGIKVVQESFHLPKESPLFPCYQTNMKNRAWEQMQKINGERRYSFAVLYSASEKTREMIISRFLEFIKWTEQVTQAEKPTDVFQINFDFLQWSGE